MTLTADMVNWLIVWRRTTTCAELCPLPWGPTSELRSGTVQGPLMMTAMTKRLVVTWENWLKILGIQLRHVQWPAARVTGVMTQVRWRNTCIFQFMLGVYMALYFSLPESAALAFSGLWSAALPVYFSCCFCTFFYRAVKQQNTRNKGFRSYASSTVKDSNSARNELQDNFFFK